MCKVTKFEISRQKWTVFVLKSSVLIEGINPFKPTKYINSKIFSLKTTYLAHFIRVVLKGKDKISLAKRKPVG